MKKRQSTGKRGKDVRQAEVTAMASERLVRLREWIDEDPTTRGYASMTDAEVATDMVEVEKVPKGALSKWDVLAKTDWAEFSGQFDDDVNAVGSDASAKRMRMVGYLAFMGGDSAQIIPADHYDTQKKLARRCFGAGSKTNTDVSDLLDSDTMSRAEYLGFPRDDVASMTDRVAKARALP